MKDLGNTLQAHHVSRLLGPELPQLRNAQFPLGLLGLGEVQKQLVETGNDLATFTACGCLAWHHNASCSAENPKGSGLYGACLILLCWRRFQDLGH